LAHQGPPEPDLSKDAAYRAFVRRRRMLNQRLDDTRARLESWIEENDSPASNHDIALLEGLLAASRQALQELIEMDDEFMTYLIKARQGDQPKE
jgi:hypothetical protein